jgi:hypothetical protein
VAGRGTEERLNVNRSNAREKSIDFHRCSCMCVYCHIPKHIKTGHRQIVLLRKTKHACIAHM